MTTDAALRWLGGAPLFDPEQGTTVIDPPGSGAGWWVGAPSALFDAGSGRYYLYYRVRKPRAFGRGGECRIAAGTDGVHFETIWSAGKDAFDSPSIERGCLLKTPEGKWRLYLSFVDPADNRWRIDLLEADTPDAFDPAGRRRVLTAADVGGEGVKDPIVFLLGGLYVMVVSYAPGAGQPVAAEQMHGTADVYNTGVVKSHTGLAVSADGVSFRWEGDILTPPDAGWDSYCTRISTLLYTPPVWTALYDGSASVEGNYEERAGLAVSLDLRRFERLSMEGPAFTSPHASGSVRYVESLRLPDHVRYYYEYARPDGSHELRTSVA